MHLHRLIAIVAALVAAFALAIPAGAQTEEAPDQDREAGNPVAHCLPGQADGGEDGSEESEESDSEEGEESESEPEEGDESESEEGEESDEAEDPESETVTPAQEDDQEASQDDLVSEDGEEPAEGDDASDGEEPAEGDEESEGDDARQDGSGNDQTEDGVEGDEDGEANRSDVAKCVLDSLPDIVGNAHAASVVAVVSNGIAQGKADGTYGPQDPVTRAQMATFLSRALNLAPSEHAELPDDVDAGNPHADAVAAVIEEGIALGKADGSFGPNEPVSRGQMASFLDRALDLVEQAGGELPEDAKGNVHEKAIEAVTDNGIAQGFTDGTFRPNEHVTRGQMATFLTRALDL